MQLRDLMTETVLTIPSTATIRQAAQLMADENVGFLPVIHEQDVCIGVLTDRDIVVRVVADGIDPATTAVAQAMSSGTRSTEIESDVNARIAALPEDTPVEEALQFMDERNVHHVAVCDSEYRIIGVATKSDLLAGTKREGAGVWQPY